MSKLWKALALLVLGALMFSLAATAGPKPPAQSAQISVRVEPMPLEWSRWGPGYYFGGPNAGSLHIRTDSSRAFVFVDGHYVGNAREIGWLTLLPGTHSVELRDNEGRVSHKQVVKIKVGKLSTVDFRS
jgi:hypothetical protein